jgi:hypothetical protein
MTTTWKSGNEKSTNDKTEKQATNKQTISGTALSSWSRQQKFAMIAGFAILGVMLGVSACSKQSPKPALVGVTSNTTAPAPMAASLNSVPSTPTTPTTAAVKKVHKKRPANVTYSDPNSGISFLYPRKFSLTTGESEPEFSAVGDAPMNFVQPGGVALATVAVPSNLYPGTDFDSAFLNVNVNRSVSEQECSHFAFIDTRNADSEPVDAEKVKVGSMEMEKTSDFSAGATAQRETQYFHNYENGACYEYVLGVSTAGFGEKDGITPVDRDKIFAKLESILATVKITAMEPEAVAQKLEAGATGKE